MTTKKDIAEAARIAGLEVATYNPGSTQTRYRFFPHNGEHSKDGYFASSGELYTALGPKEALSFIAGYQAGLRGCLVAAEDGKYATLLERSGYFQDRHGEWHEGDRSLGKGLSARAVCEMHSIETD
jgi:hypothetical protein